MAPGDPGDVARDGAVVHVAGQGLVGQAAGEEPDLRVVGGDNVAAQVVDLGLESCSGYRTQAHRQPFGSAPAGEKIALTGGLPPRGAARLIGSRS